MFNVKLERQISPQDILLPAGKSEVSNNFLSFTLLWISYLLFFRFEFCMKLSLNKVNQFFYWALWSHKVRPITFHYAWYFWNREKPRRTPFSPHPCHLDLHLLQGLVDSLLWVKHWLGAWDTNEQANIEAVLKGLKLLRGEGAINKF